MGSERKRKVNSSGHSRGKNGLFSAKDSRRGRKSKEESIALDDYVISAVETAYYSPTTGGQCSSSSPSYYFDSSDELEQEEMWIDNDCDMADNIDVCEKIDLTEGMDEDTLTKFVDSLKDYRPKSSDTSLFGIRKGCGDGRTQHYSRLQQRRLREKSHQGPGMDGYFNHCMECMNEFESCVADLEEEVYEEGSLKYTFQLMDECIEKLEREGSTNSRSEETESDYCSWQRIISKAISGFFRAMRIEDEKGRTMGPVAASIEVTFYLYNGLKGKDSYRSRKVREWSRHYAIHKELPKFDQGKHSKRLSPVADEFSREKMREHLRSMRDFERTPENFATAYNDDEGELRSSLADAPPTISIDTARRWMIIVGFSLRKMKKSYYTDDHNRADVLRYRDEIFLPKMKEYESRMSRYERSDRGEEEEVVYVPSDGGQRVVHITHDEMTVYSNECKKACWREGHYCKILPKGKGRSTMISGFTCICHGFPVGEVNGELVKSFLLFEAGGDRQGFFTNNDLVSQLERSIPLFKQLHPGCELLITFDNSMSHHKRHPTGLDATLLNMNDGGKNVPKNVRDGWYYKLEERDRDSSFIGPLRYEKVIQKMQHDSGEAKGLKTVLTERGLWDARMKLLCYDCKRDHHRMDPSRRKDEETLRDHGDDWIGFTDKCCARGCLRRQPDFLEQREWLTEVCEENGLRCLFFPKYHCELNYIEVVWAFIRHRLRRDCDFNYNGMKRRMEELLNGGVPLEVFRKNSRFCFRFMDGYRRGLEGPLLDWANKKFSGKRRLPLSLTNESLVAQYAEYKRLKETKKSKMRRFK